MTTSKAAEQFSHLKDFKQTLDSYRERKSVPHLKLTAYLWWIGNDDRKEHLSEIATEEYNNFIHPLDTCGLVTDPVKYISQRVHIDTWDAKVQIMVLYDGQYFPPPIMEDKDRGKCAYGAIYEVRQDICDYGWRPDPDGSFWLTSLETDKQGRPQLAKMLFE